MEEQEIKESEMRMKTLEMYMKNARAVLDTTQEIGLKTVKELFDSINKWRHDYYLARFQEENDMNVTRGDVSVLPAVIGYMKDNDMFDEAIKLESRIAGMPYEAKNKTPDIFKIDKNENDEIEITIGDVSVSRTGKRMLANKYDKYKPILNSLLEYNANMIVSILDPMTGEVSQGQWGYSKEYSTPKLEDQLEIYSETESLKREMTSRLSMDNKELFTQWMEKKGHKEDDELNDSLTFDFGLSAEEYIKFTKSSKNFKRIASESPDLLKLMNQLLYRYRKDEHEVNMVNKINLSNHLTQDFHSDKDFDKILESKWNELMSLSEINEPKVMPRPPTEEEINKAFLDMENSVKDNYAIRSSPGILSPIPMNYRMTGSIKSTGIILKKHRLSRLYSVLNSIKKPDDTIKALKMITEPFSKIPDSEYSKFLNGEFVLTSDGKFMESKQFISYLNRANQIKQRVNQDMRHKDAMEIISESLSLGKLHGVSMKKGEVISIRPTNIKEIQELLKKTATGTKEEMKEREVIIKPKVKSLEFWDKDRSSIMLDEFQDQVKKFRHTVEMISEVYETKEEMLIAERPEDTKSNSDDSNSSSNNAERVMFEKGLNYLMRHNEILFENMAHASYMGNSGFRIVQGITDNTFIIIFPSESILKGDTGTPYITVSVCDKEDIRNNFGDVNESSYFSPLGMVYVTGGRRIDRNRLTGYLRVRHMFEAAKISMNSFQEDNGLSPLNSDEESMLYLYVNNISINTSSYLDNIRYMAENCIADMSCCKEFIEEKYKIPVKNLLHMYLYSRSKDLLSKLNAEMKTTKVRTAMEDEDGNVNIDTARIVKGNFPSFFFPGRFYTKIQSLLSEIQCLFFSITKGLHGKFHNQVEIHKTPIKIQLETEKHSGILCPHDYTSVKHRSEFNPFMMILSTKEAEANSMAGRAKVRANINSYEGMNSTPLLSKTTSSTRSTLIEIKAKERYTDNNRNSLQECPQIHFLSEYEIDKFGENVQIFENQIFGCKSSDVKKKWRTWKKLMVNNMSVDDKQDESDINMKKRLDLKKEKMKSLLDEKMRINTDSKRVELTSLSGMQETRFKVRDILQENSPDKHHRFYSSGVVLSEVLKKYLSNYNAVTKDIIENPESQTVSEMTISTMAKEAVMSSETWKFGIRPKGQRTQKDREIFILDLNAKMGIYPIEHTYKQICSSLVEEKISEPGDGKIISLKKQVMQGFKHLGNIAKRRANIKSKFTKMDDMTNEIESIELEMQNLSTALDEKEKISEEIKKEGIQSLELQSEIKTLNMKIEEKFVKRNRSLQELRDTILSNKTIGNRENQEFRDSVVKATENFLEAEDTERLRSEFTRTINEMKEAEQMSENEKLKLFHFNLDMTKWAPRDNLLKFLFVIASSVFLNLDEKLYMIAAIIKMSEKQLYIDENLFYKTYKNSKKYMNEEGEDAEECVFKEITNDFKTNLVNIELTWLQGVLNYISSYVHAGCMMVWEKSIRKVAGIKDPKVQINVHSDDSQTSIYCYSGMSDEAIISELWRRLDFFTKNVCIEISIKKSYISKLIKLFLSQYNIAGEQAYLWIKSAMSAISGCPYTTLKDDMSSLLSKLSEALSKGAPKEVASSIVKSMSLHIWDVYGIRTPEGKNKFAELLSVKQEHLPTCLGGNNIFDFTSLAVAGPKTCDQFLILNLLKNYGATCDIEPDILPKTTRGKEKEHRAIRLISVLDQLSEETPEDNSVTDSTYTSLNPLKNSRYKVRRTGQSNPFFDIDPDIAREMEKRFKEENPGLAFMKPRNRDFLVKYYFSLYQNSNFLSVMAGQSPDMLQLHKKINKKRGIFKFKVEGDVLNSKYQPDEDVPEYLTPEMLSNILNKIVDNHNVDLSMAKHMWSKYVRCDPEFKVLSYCQEHKNRSNAIIRKNPTPIKKPNFDDYGEILNPLPLLLCYFFDEKYFKINGFKMPIIEALTNDLQKLASIFPLEIGWLETKSNIEIGMPSNPLMNSNIIEIQRNIENKKRESKGLAPISKDQWKKSRDDIKSTSPNANTTYNNYRAVKKEMNGLEQMSFQMAKENRLFRSGNLETRLTFDVEREVKKALGNDDTMQSGQTMAEAEMIKDLFNDERDLPNRLLKISRAYKGRTRKVLFVAPVSSMDFSDVCLAMRSQIESPKKMHITYYLTKSQKQSARLIMLSKIGNKQGRIKEFAMNISGLYSLANLFTNDISDLRDLMMSSEFMGVTIHDLRSSFKKQQRYIKTRCIVPLCVAFPERIPIFIEELNPISIVWIQPEEGGSMEFIAKASSPNVSVLFTGRNKRIYSMRINHTKDCITADINNIIRTFGADLVMRDRNNIYSYRLYDILPLKMIQHGDKESLGDTAIVHYSQIYDRFVEVDSPLKTHIVTNISSRVVKINKLRSVVRSDCMLIEDLTGIDYNEGENRVRIYHRTNINAAMESLSFDDMELEYMSLKKLIRSPMAKLMIKGDFNRIMMKDYVFCMKNTGIACASSGGIGSVLMLDCLEGLRGELGNIADECMEGIRGLQSSNHPDSYGEEFMSTMNEKYPFMEERDNMIRLKKSRWFDVIQKKEKEELKFASTVMTFWDRSEEIYNSTASGGMIVDLQLNPIEELKNFERRKIRMSKQVTIGDLLEEAGIGVTTAEDDNFQRVAMTFILALRMSNSKRWNSQLLSFKQRVSILPTMMQHFEVSCVMFGGEVIETFLETQDMPDTEEIFLGLEEMHKKNKDVLSSSSLAIRRVCKDLHDFFRQKNQSTAYLQLMSKLKKKTGPTRRLKGDKSSMVKAAMNMPVLALDARTDIKSANDLLEISKNYNTGTETERSETDLDAHCVEEKKLKNSYPGMTLKRSVRSKLAIDQKIKSQTKMTFAELTTITKDMEDDDFDDGMY